MANDSKNQDSSKGGEPALLFFLPFFGYALAYVFEAGAFVWADAPLSLIAISVPQIAAGCITLIVPLWAAAFATSNSTKHFLGRGWKGIRFLLLVALVGFGTISAFGVWQDDVVAIFLFAAALFFVVIAIMWNRVVESSYSRIYIFDYPPLVRKIFSVGILGVLSLLFGLAAGVVVEKSTKHFRVVDVHCGAYSRVFRTNGDLLLVFPAFRGPEYSFELWSLSNKGTVRIKRVDRDEYISRQAIAGPCPQ